MATYNDKTMTGKEWADLLSSGYKNLALYADLINDLNVFPVPDGDTGSNMRVTTMNGIEYIKDAQSIGDVASNFATGSLFGARGNSGVLLSQYFKGIALSLKGKETATLPELAEALQAGYQNAYKAAIKPTEGTILTVAREGIESVLPQVNEDTPFVDFFSMLVEAMKLSLDNTPNLLAVLKEHGVIDSGGKGLLTIFEGVLAKLQGKGIRSLENDIDDHENHETETIDFSVFNENSTLDYGYCTEFILQLLNSKANPASFDLQAFIAWLEEHGDSIVCFQDGTMVKVHIHTKRPSVIIDYAQQYGEFVSFKMENMALQHNGVLAKKELAKQDRKEYAIISVAQGDGIIKLFEELGSNLVLNGGPTMNTSVTELIDAFKIVNAETIFLLPNESNLILTAHQAANLYQDSKVIVIESESLQQGYMALQMTMQTGDAESAQESLQAGIEYIAPYFVARASKDSSPEEKVSYKKGGYVAGRHKDITIADGSLNDTALKLIQSIPDAEEKEVMFVIYGKMVSLDEANELKDKLADIYPYLEVGLIPGKQEVYSYLIGVNE